MSDIDDAWEQIEKDFEDYLDKMAAGAYPEAEAVEQDVREMKKASPHIPEENLRKLAVAAIAAEKRLKKVFFIDHNEDTPETVEILLQCWHIMPVARDEDEGETWWVLGMNNTAAHDASTAGPFSTKDEAFAIALKHNRKFRVNAVYVHFRDENGKISGDFEEPTETQLTLLEQSIIEIGDKAMQDVLDDLASEQDDDA
jgi:hypothetical protein